MPHDNKSRLIEAGDIVKVKPWFSPKKFVALQVLHVYEGTDSCNVNCASFESRFGLVCVSAKDCELLMKSDGSSPDEPQTCSGVDQSPA